MKTCEFCERELPPKKIRFCSQICRDAHTNSEFPQPELGSKNQLAEYAPLHPQGTDERGYRRIRHMHQ